jgi:hypothetical protein
MAQVRQDNPGQPEFHQAVLEVCKPIFTFIKDKPRYHEYQILRRITEPDRIVSFRVCWENDQGSFWLSNRPSRTHSQACLWAVARAAPILIPRAAVTMKSCASASRS